MQTRREAGFAVDHPADLAFAIVAECAPTLAAIREGIIKSVIGAFHGIRLRPVLGNPARFLTAGKACSLLAATTNPLPREATV